MPTLTLCKRDLLTLSVAKQAFRTDANWRMSHISRVYLPALNLFSSAVTSWNRSRPVKITILVLVPCLLVVAILFLVGLPLGVLYQVRFHQATPAEEPLAILGHVNDTILLKGGINAFGYSNMAVQQCIDDADDYDVSIYVIKSDNVKKRSVKTFHSAETHYQDSPSYKSGILDYLYLLPTSSLNYTICLASTTNYDQNVTYFLFMGQQNYQQYVDDQDHGEKYSLYSMNLTANRNKQVNCTQISHTVTSVSYYFMMVNSPGNISYSYTFSLQKVEYNITNVKIYCNVSTSNNCPVSLPSKFLQQAKYDILAHVQPASFDKQSITTHLCLKNFTTSKGNLIFAIASLVIGCVGMVFSVILIIPLTCACKQWYRIRHQDNNIHI